MFGLMSKCIFLSTNIKNRKKGEELGKYEALITIAFIMNVIMILLWLVYSGYSCYIAKTEEKQENQNPAGYQNLANMGTESGQSNNNEKIN